MRWLIASLFGTCLIAACASPAELSPTKPGSIHRAGIEIFDGASLHGWENADDGPWSVQNETIEVASTRETERLWHRASWSGLPISVELEVAPLARGPSDGKMIKFIDANGLTASVSLDDDVPDSLAIYADSAGGARRRRVGGLDVVVAPDVWVSFACELDGKTLRVTQGDRVIETPYACVEPIRFLLETQRTGARFRELVLR